MADSDEYMKLSTRKSTIISALAAEASSSELSSKLRERRLITEDAYSEANKYGPDKTDTYRIEQVLDAVLDSVRTNSTHYTTFIGVLKSISGLEDIVEFIEKPLEASPSTTCSSPGKAIKLHTEGRYRCWDNAEVTGDLFKFKDQGTDTGLVKILEPLSPQLNYYECTITSQGIYCHIAVGVVGTVGQGNPLNPGPWLGIVYIADDGELYLEDRDRKAFGPTCKEGDRMGCGVVFDAAGDHGYVNIFFTRNGKQVGEPVRMKLPTNGLYPIIGLHGRRTEVNYLGHWQRTPEGN